MLVIDDTPMPKKGNTRSGSLREKEDNEEGEISFDASFNQAAAMAMNVDVSSDRKTTSTDRGIQPHGARIVRAYSLGA